MPVESELVRAVQVSHNGDDVLDASFNCSATLTRNDLAEGQHAALQRLASQMSIASRPRSVHKLSSISTPANLDKLEAVDENDPEIDPESAQFDGYKWAKWIYRAYKEEGLKFPQSGFVLRDLTVSGTGAALQFQDTVSNLFSAPMRLLGLLSWRRSAEKTILHNFNALLKGGEMLIVLGRPGSGCSTFLKAICGELHGLHVDETSMVHYNGVPQEQMLREFRGEVIYNQEVDKHFPHLTVGETLEFAAAARTPQRRVKGATRQEYIKHMAGVVMAVFGISHTCNTKVGNDFIRGVSGGERKRVSIAEMALSGSPIGAWDNSTRGLDAASALEFVDSLRVDTNFCTSCHAVAIYQASQAIYDTFDKAAVLYEGRLIFYGPCDEAEAYFVEMGYEKPPRQTTADFLTSVTNPSERRIRSDMESKVPRTPIEFELHWKGSPLFKRLMQEIDDHERSYPIGDRAAQELHETKLSTQARHVRERSPYMISSLMQLSLCTKRAYQRIINDIGATITVVISQVVMALIIASIFYGQGKNSTSSFFSKGAVLFFAVLFNALIAESEIHLMYDQRPIVEKHKSFALYHPWAEALSGVIVDLPVKFTIAVAFNLVMYFLAELRTDGGQFFFVFLLFTYLASITMSVVFRTIASLTKTVSQAMAIAGVVILVLIIYTGFVVPPERMVPWFSWLKWLNPTYYIFEALMANEFHGRSFNCAAASVIPAYPNVTGNTFICSENGAVAGQTQVEGDAFIMASYGYTYANIWRNLGIVIAFLVFWTAAYLISSELNSSTTSSAEYLIFRKGRAPHHAVKVDNKEVNIETPSERPVLVQTQGHEAGATSAITAQKDTFTWRRVCYDIPVRDGQRRLLDNVSGWVRPGTLTALMGVSGAGKTTLLDVLAKRVSLGTVTGDMFVNGKPLDLSFQRKTGYVQQQDLHVETSTVREALRFSAMLRQPKTVSTEEKYNYVESVIDMLGMGDYAEAIVGLPGSGLNVEQRKLLTIGVELAAKPALLLFLDEPTSGLDSQSSWAICAFLRKLANHGQAVLCTIHQPSAILFQEFDRLLFLAKGGKTVYFGDVGEQSRTLLDYFEINGARACDPTENPAEYMLEVVGAGASGKATSDWPAIWSTSPQARQVQTELERIHAQKMQDPAASDDSLEFHEFAMPFSSQLYHVTVRVSQQFWRTPSYIAGKFALGIISGLFIGFSYYKPDSSQQGFQTILYAILMLLSIVATIVQQVMPIFVQNRSLFEVRERPSKAYSWLAFLTANIAVEIPYQIVLAVCIFGAWYYPVFGTGEPAKIQGVILLLLVQTMVFSSSLAHLVIAALPDAETAGTVATILFTMMYVFSGVLQTPDALPRFWTFMYRADPFTYYVGGIVGSGLHDRAIECSDIEFKRFDPPPNLTCGAYLSEYLSVAPGRLSNPGAMQNCKYCPLSNSDQFLGMRRIFYAERWQNYGIGFAFIAFNIFGAVFLYYSFRVKKWSASKVTEQLGQLLGQMFRRRSGDVSTARKSGNSRIF